MWCCSSSYSYTRNIILCAYKNCATVLLICGDFNINWADSNDNICKKLFNILEAFNLQQHIKNSTHKSGHLLDYIISDGRLINSVSISDFISDHCALHATIACTRDHPGQKKITYSATFPRANLSLL